jgi:hypothetical protein
MVPPPEQNQVRQRRQAALSPVPDVMALSKAQPAAREATALITVLEHDRARRAVPRDRPDQIAAAWRGRALVARYTTTADTPRLSSRNAVKIQKKMR